MHTLEPILERHPFFEGLEPRHLTLMTGCTSNVRFDAGAFLFEEGGNADRFYLIREGRVALEVRPQQSGGGGIPIQTVGAGDILGWSWLVPPHRWRFRARALEPTRALALDGACLRAKCEEDHDLGYFLYRRFVPVMAERLQATRMQLLDVYAAWQQTVEGRG